MTAFDDMAVLLMDLAAKPCTSEAEHAVYEELLLSQLTAADPQSEEQLELLLDAPLSWRRDGAPALPAASRATEKAISLADARRSAPRLRRRSA